MNLTNFIALLFLNPTSSFSTQRVFISTPAKQNIKIVSDLMTQNPFTLSPSTPVDEAIASLLAAGVSGAPVVERLKSQNDKVELSLVGFVSSFDFLPREESGLITLGEMEDSETARRILGQSVGEIMTREPVTVTTNDFMKTAAEVMAKHR
jgi:CBS domain-containing protein